MKVTKLQARQKRAKRGRAKMRQLSALRLCVHKSANHIYAQIIKPGVSATGGVSDETLLSASTLDNALREQVKHTGNIDAAKKVGEAISKKALAAGINKLAFDRSGFKYHGRIRALAEVVREQGIAM